MSKRAQKYTEDSLMKMGVKVILNKNVKDYVDDTVILADGQTIQTKTLLWTAGVTSNSFEDIPKGSYGKEGRLLVDEYNKVQGTDNIYAIGDMCLQTSDKNFQQGHPQLAQVAIQQSKNLGKNFKAMLSGKPFISFAYTDKGTMAIIGRTKAAADISAPRMHIKGFVAWVMWLFVHLLSLINYRNRIKTFYNWAVAFFTKDQSLRMIIRPRPEC
jgi:NADH dehydrogenase